MVSILDDMLYRLYNSWLPCPLPVHSLLIKRTIFDRYGLFDETFKAVEDRLFFSKLAVVGVKFDHFPFVGAYRRKHKESVAKKTGHTVKYTIEFYKKMGKEVDDSFFVGVVGDKNL